MAVSNKKRGSEEVEHEDSKRQKQGKRAVEVRKECPYLDTVNRKVLDFDFSNKGCCLSLGELNVYACLVCGQFYGGKGPKTPAYAHSIKADHHVYINLHTSKFYCLPEGYEISNSSLDDVRHLLNPKFMLDGENSKLLSTAGLVGLNNSNKIDFVNVVVQSLMRVKPLRDFFLKPENYQHCKSPLVNRFGELTRRIWHPRNFKGHVSPLEFWQAVMNTSNGRFQSGVLSDPIEFLDWLLTTLHEHLTGNSSTTSSSIIQECFQGEIQEDTEYGDIVGDATNKSFRRKFLMLDLDLPLAPLFKDPNSSIPQVLLFDLLNKFDGETITQGLRYRITKLPPYLILNIRRFKENTVQCIEKNPTLVTFPIKNLDMKNYIQDQEERQCSKYNLVANIVHQGGNTPNQGAYRAHVQRESEQNWYEVQDLFISEKLPQLVALSEAYAQIYELQ